MSLRTYFSVNFLLFLSLFLVHCSDGPGLDYNNGYRPTDLPGDYDFTETGGIDEPCTEGELKCATDEVVLVCEGEANWVFSELCTGGEICFEGECMEEGMIDGDLDGENAEDAEGGELEGEQDQAEQDGDAENAEITDGDVTDDDYESTDGDIDIAIDGDDEIEEEAPWRCRSNDDCEFGFRCDPLDSLGGECVYASECEADADCGNYAICVEDVHWMVCRPVDQCESHADCEYGNRCVLGDNQIRVCVYANECESDADCYPNETCVEAEYWTVCETKPPEDECRTHADCDYGYSCSPSDSGIMLCVEANECRRDVDCGEDEMCVNGEFWKICDDRPPEDECNHHSDCDYGYSCTTGEAGVLVCMYANECEADAQCAADEACIEGPYWLVCEAQGQEGCASHADCDFGYACDDSTDPPECVYANECSNDADCQTWEVCETVDHWKECVLNTQPDWCQSDGDCGPGMYCDILFGGFGTCKSLNECETDAECEYGFVCEFNGDYNECIEDNPCQTDADCGFGYRCVQDPERNYCEYANECSTDDDCQAWESCVAEGNWTVCKIGGTGICFGDDDCEPDQYCASTIGPIGTCKSRNQCYVDEDCGDGMVCESNGDWNECVAEDPQSCWFDFQCPEGWSCKDGECAPPQVGVCSEIEGEWSVLTSDCRTLIMGQGYLFEPEDGCTGSITSATLPLPVGSFDQIESGRYDISLNLTGQCEGSLNFGFLTITCDTCTSRLSRF